MDVNSIVALFLAMTTLALLPSTSVLVVVARSMTSGFKHGVMTAAGILCGDFFFIFLAVYGLSAIANHLASLFNLVRYLGAAYLIWMGTKLWSSNTQTSKIARLQDASYLSSFTSGLLITLADFKAIFFYVSFFPAFLDLQRITIQDLIIILTIATVASGGVKVGYGYLAVKAKLFAHNSNGDRRIYRLAATTMICVAIFLIVKP